MTVKYWGVKLLLIATSGGGSTGSTYFETRGEPAAPSLAHARARRSGARAPRLAAASAEESPPSPRSRPVARDRIDHRRPRGIWADARAAARAPQLCRAGLGGCCGTAGGPATADAQRVAVRLGAFGRARDHGYVWAGR